MTAARLTTFLPAAVVVERRLTELWVMVRANDMVVVLVLLYRYIDVLLFARGVLLWPLMMVIRM